MTTECAAREYCRKKSDRTCSRLIPLSTILITIILLSSVASKGFEETKRRSEVKRLRSERGVVCGDDGDSSRVVEGRILFILLPLFLPLPPLLSFDRCGDDDADAADDDESCALLEESVRSLNISRIASGEACYIMQQRKEAKREK